MTRPRKPRPIYDWGGPEDRRKEVPNERHAGSPPEDKNAGEDQLPVLARGPETSALDVARPELVREARDAIRASRAEATLRGYERDWERFKKWVRAENLLPFLPAKPEVVVLYLTALAREGTPSSGRRAGRVGRSPATVDRARAAIRYHHHQGQHVSPTDHPAVIEVVKGLRRRHEDPTFRVRPLMPEHLARIVPWLEKSRSRLRFLRDRAILLGGFAGAFRRGELSGLQRADVRIREDGIYFALARQQGETIATTVPGTKHHAASENKGVSFERDPELARLGVCPIAALREWAEASGGEPASFFVRAVKGDEVLPEPVSTRKVARLVQSAATAVGLDGTAYAAHSLRAGMATYLIWRRQWNIFAVRDYLRHDNVETLNHYVRDWDELPPEAPAANPSAG